MSVQTLNRDEWLKAVTQAECVNDAAARVATALVTQFANNETGQLNPSVKTPARYLKKSPDTLKRATGIWAQQMSAAPLTSQKRRKQ